MANNTKIGERIKQAREERGLTLEELAKELGLNKSTIQRYESAKIGKIKLPIIEAIAQKLNVNPEWLSDKTDIRTTYATPASTSSLSELMKDVKRPNRVSGVAADLHSESNNVIFTGHPGTGKTTIAHLIDKLMESPENTVHSKTAESRHKKIQEKYFGVDFGNKETKIDTEAKPVSLVPCVINFDEHGNLIAIKDNELLDYYNQLNENGKKEAVKRVKELTQLPEYTADIPVYTKSKE